MNNDAKINYLELPATDLVKIKQFYQQVFNWQFTDYGPEYVAFSNAGIDGGFYQSTTASQVANGSVLIVFYSTNLATVEQAVIDAGGTISKPTFSFPGGQRFHFCDPCGNELAVWSDQ